MAQGSFAAMPEGERSRWLAWARGHDWGGERPAHWDEADPGQMVVYGWQFRAGDDVGEYTVDRVASPADLRAFAGY